MSPKNLYEIFISLFPSYKGYAKSYVATSDSHTIRIEAKWGPELIFMYVSPRKWTLSCGNEIK